MFFVAVPLNGNKKEKMISVNSVNLIEGNERARESLKRIRPSVCLGTDLRLESRKLNGFALTLEDQMLHLAVFPRVSNGNRNQHFSKMARFSNRSEIR